MKFENGEIVKTGGLLPNTVFDSDEVKAICMVIRDEIQKMNDEAEKIDGKHTVMRLTSSTESKELSR